MEVTDMLRYKGFRVRLAESNFGTSGTLFRIIAQTEKGTDRKDGKEWTYRYDPSMNNGHGAVVEDTLDPDAHVLDYHDEGYVTDACPVACPNTGLERDDRSRTAMCKQQDDEMAREMRAYFERAARL
jgi:hypothetical protein